ncbi:vesicle-associated protein 1-2-like [Nymphaea colorata]|nr:vesicle-associated protein 1-2-like [Nymphaea colorata]
MTMELLDIQPTELKFTFELKKQSSCSVQMFNNSDQYVAYKVRTTNPKKYCVRPNINVISPKASCEIIITMQAQQIAPPDMKCKDKFLILSTAVPDGTTVEQISHDIFAKEDGRAVEERKLKVALINPPNSPILQPIDGVVRQEPTSKASRPEEGVDAPNGNNSLPSQTVTKDVGKLIAKLSEAEKVITSLREERKTLLQQQEVLQEELGLAKKQNKRRQIRVGYPFLFVCFIGLVGLMSGSMLHL